MPLLARKKTILAKIETTYGVDPTPTGAANAILVRDLEIMPLEADYVDRALIRTYIGASENLPANVRTSIKFKVEMAGSGAAGTAPAWAPLLRACGRSETLVASTTATYAGISAAFESVTIYFNIDGVFHKMLGCLGNPVFDFPNKGIPTIEFTFVGIYVAVADAAAPTPTYSGFIKPLTVGNQNTTPFTLHGYSALASALSIDIGNTVEFRSLIGGAERVYIGDRATTGSVTIEATTVAAKDWFAICKAATIGALDITQGTVAGNKVQVTSSGVQLTNPRYTEDGVAQMLQMDMRFVPTTGNDELSIVVK